MRTTIAMATFLLVGAGAASVSALNLKGSDTIKEVTIDLLTQAAPNCGGVSQGGTLIYDGTGSTNGQAAILAGTQQVAPMSRAFNNGANICTNAGRTTAEGIVFALDGLSLAVNATNWGTCNGAADPTCTPQPALGLAASKTITPDATRTCMTAADCNVGGIFGEACTAGVCTYTIPTWREALRILFAGMNDPNSDTANRNQMSRRNCSSPERKWLASHWLDVFQSCASTACQNTGTATNAAGAPAGGGILHAFRRNDESGTSDVFVSLLNLPSISQPNSSTPFCNAGTTGPTLTGAGPAAPIPGNPFPVGAGVCDGTNAKPCQFGPQATAPGSPANLAAVVPPPGGNNPVEPPSTIFVAAYNTTASFDKYVGPYWIDMQDRDPIRRTCQPTLEDVCEARGDLGLVLPIWDPPSVGTGESAFPTQACSNGVFQCFNAERINVGPASGAKYDLCPDGVDPNTGDAALVCAKGQCAYPVFRTPGTGVLDPRCVNARGSTPNELGTGKIDGRVYNLTLWKGDPLSPGSFVRASETRATGLSTTSTPNPQIQPATNVDMVGAFYRIHQGHSFKTLGGSAALCNANLHGGLPVSATDLLGCLVQASPCSIAYTGNEGVSVAVNGVQDAIAAKVHGIDPADPCVRQLLVNSNPDTNANLYPLSRKLYLNTLKGFGNVTGDELALANCFAQRSVTDSIVTTRGFITLSAVAADRPSFCEDFNEVSVCGDALNVDACKDAPLNVAPIPKCELADPIASCP